VDGGQTRLPDGARRVRAVDEIIGRLCDLLVGARLPRYESIEIASTANIDARNVSWADGDGPFWDDVVRRAHTQGAMKRLFEAADYVFKNNPEWATAKQDYRTALTTPSPKPSSRADKPVATVDLAFHERQLKALRDALDLIYPGIFKFRSVQVSRLDAARKALLAVDPVIEMTHAAASHAVGRRCQNLQLIAQLLKKYRESVSRELIALESVNSEGAALKLCDDLTRDSGCLLDQYRQAIDYGT